MPQYVSLVVEQGRTVYFPFTGGGWRDNWQSRKKETGFFLWVSNTENSSETWVPTITTTGTALSKYPESLQR